MKNSEIVAVGDLWAYGLNRFSRILVVDKDRNMVTRTNYMLEVAVEVSLSNMDLEEWRLVSHDPIVMVGQKWGNLEEGLPISSITHIDSPSAHLSSGGQMELRYGYPKHPGWRCYGEKSTEQQEISVFLGQILRRKRKTLESIGKVTHISADTGTFIFEVVSSNHWTMGTSAGIELDNGKLRNPSKFGYAWHVESKDFKHVPDCGCMTCRLPKKTPRQLFQEAVEEAANCVPNGLTKDQWKGILINEFHAEASHKAFHPSRVQRTALALTEIYEKKYRAWAGLP